jgi:hemolysin activation/secretion protein
MLFLQALPIGALLAGTGARAAEGIVLGSVAATDTFFVAEYRVHNVHALTALEVETAVYPFLGPDRTVADVKAACTALEAAYRAKGFGAASVQPDPNVGVDGVVHLQVSEGTVERLRVKGAKYFSPRRIKAAAPSLAEGKVINFNDVSQDVVALNQSRDRTVTPVLSPGAEPGTYDIDLNVKDSPPVHGSLELNDYRSPNTVPLRVTAAASDSNLAQSGQGAGVSFELAPQRGRDSEVLTGYYLAKLQALDRWSFLIQGTKQDSDISTLGGSTVAGPGETVEFQAILALPPGKDWATGKDWENFSHSVSIGIDYKSFRQSLNPGGDSSTGSIVTPITYYPITANYNATVLGWAGKGSETDLNAGITMHFRGMGSGPNVFDLNRYGADGGFIYFRGSVAHTQDLPGGLQGFVKVQGQLANQPLVSSEEFSGGGVETVRGYLESETVADDGGFASVELRSPQIKAWFAKKTTDWRVYAFGDGGKLILIDPLPEQQAHFYLASVGLGSRLSLGDHVSGGCDAAYPLYGQAYTKAHDPRVTFRVGVDY